MFRTFTSTASLLIAGAVLTAGSPDPAQAQNVPGLRQFAYIANQNSDNISGYKLNAKTGALLPSQGFSFGNQAEGASWVVTDPAGRFLYATEPFSGANAVAGFKIERPGGRLVPIPGMPVSGENGPVSMAVDPSGRFAYVVNQGSNSVSGYTIRPNTGRLVPITGSPFATGDFPSAVAIDSAGKFVYVTNESAATISGFTIDPQTGALTPIPGNPFATNLAPVSIAIDPNSRFVYVANNGSNDVDGYSIDPASGALAVLPTSPFAAGAGGLNGVTFDPTGNFVYVAGYGGIFSFSVTQNRTSFIFQNGGNFPVSGYGQLTPINGSPFGGGNPASLAVDYTGTFAYAADKSSNVVSAFTLSNGVLTANTQSPVVDAGSSPVSIALVKPSRAPSYSATTIPALTLSGLPTKSFIAAAINNKGDVIGSAVFFPDGGENFAYGFLYAGGAVITIGHSAGNHLSQAFAINDSDQAVGQMSLLPPSPLQPPEQAFLYSNGVSTNIDNVSRRQSAALGINNAGQITGSLSTGPCAIPCTSDIHAFLNSGSGLMDLGTLGGTFSEGLSINNNGEIFGVSSVNNGNNNHLFRYSNGSMHDLGTLHGYGIVTAAANDNGEVVGNASSSTNTTGYLFRNGVFHALPFAPNGINRQGDVVGGRTFPNGSLHAVIFQGSSAQDGSLTDLNRLVDPSLTLLTGAADINNRGQIVASGLDGNLYVLTPNK